ncbi:hypothetical protein B0H67DRAFT_648938 [Lasiosphaeris hirsuta]|uniref:Ankyrin repeat protein n=1 Tax=Lasiosphaeris hirsuta TaxID=260670 RepID=A0AA40DIJ9_9PEZI|nr:hypothetical protein B0H67DRAFT_648938 [Lasiosphaeris hirsuta]
MLRAFVRRDLAKLPTAHKLRPGFEMDWLATKLAFNLFPGQRKKGNEEKNDKKKTASSSWLLGPVSGNDEENEVREARGWIIKPIIQTAQHALDPMTLPLSTSHLAMKLRKGIADLAPWPRPLHAEARAVASAIETTLNFCLLESRLGFSFSSNHRSSLGLGSGDGSNGGNGGGDDGVLIWHVETFCQGNIYFFAHRDQLGQWRVSETEIEAAISLWNYGVHVSTPKIHMQPLLTVGLDDRSQPKLGPTPGRVLRLLAYSIFDFEDLLELREHLIDELKTKDSEAVGYAVAVSAISGPTLACESGIDLAQNHFPGPKLGRSMDGNMGAVVELVNSGADVNASDSLRNTALHWAAFLGYEDIVDNLLPLTNPVLRTAGGRTALHHVALSGKMTDARLQTMLDKGYDTVLEVVPHLEGAGRTRHLA